MPEPAPTRIGVLVVDDNDTFRAVMREVVDATPRMTCVGEAASGEAALDAVERLGPRMVVMDQRMRGLGGLDAARRMRARWPGLVVVLVSVDTPEPTSNGATASLSKRELAPRTLAEVWRRHGCS